MKAFTMRKERLVQNLGKVLGELEEIEIGKLNKLDLRVSDIVKRLEAVSSKVEEIEEHMDSIEKLGKIVERMEALEEKISRYELSGANKKQAK